MLLCYIPILFAVWRKNVDIGSVKINVLRNVFLSLI